MRDPGPIKTQNRDCRSARAPDLNLPAAPVRVHILLHGCAEKSRQLGGVPARSAYGQIPARPRLGWSLREAPIESLPGYQLLIPLRRTRRWKILEGYR